MPPDVMPAQATFREMVGGVIAVLVIGALKARVAELEAAAANAA